MVILREWCSICVTVNKYFDMPWYNGDYPPSYKNQPPRLREKAVEIANEMLLNGAEEGVAIATGLKQARLYFKKEDKKKSKKTG
jgi:uncharacterized protein YdaT